MNFRAAIFGRSRELHKLQYKPKQNECWAFIFQSLHAHQVKLHFPNSLRLMDCRIHLRCYRRNLWFL